MNIELPIGKLAEYIEEYNNCLLHDNKEICTANLDIRVPTVDGTSKINFFIKKNDLKMVEVGFSTGYTVRLAEKHILRQFEKDVFVENLKVGDFVDHRDGPIQISYIHNIESEDCYDIGIDAPHLYYDKNGLIHHNTIITAALSKSVEHLGRSLVIVPNKSLVVQTEADYINLGLDVGVYFGDRKDYGKTHTICTWQSLNNLFKNTADAGEENIDEFFFEDIACVLVDECFDGSEKVLTPEGYLPIKEIKEGDKVINYSELTNEFKEDIVVKQHINLTKSDGEKMYELEFDNGSVIKVTGNHKFLTNLGWCRADELTENHEIINRKHANPTRVQ
jgi:hypothetical protein